MKSRVKIYISKLFILIGLVLPLFFVSCVETASKRSAKSSSVTPAQEDNTEENDETTPTFSSDVYFQSGSSTTTGTITLNISSSNTLYLRGKAIYEYIKNDNLSSIKCMTYEFDTSVGKKVLIWALSPKFFIQTATGLREYYYLISPNDKVFNSTFCNSTDFQSSIITSYPAATTSFSIAETCPTCIEQPISKSNKVLNSDGTQINKIEASSLSVRISSATPTQTVGGSCSSHSDCSSNYDCCLQNTCVKDKTVRSTTNQSSTEYLQSLDEIASNPNAIFKYDHLYYICSTAPPVSPEDPDPTDSDPPKDSAKLLIQSKEYYDCLNPSEGEMSLCTEVIENASSYTGTIQTSVDDLSFKTNAPPASNLPSHSIYKVTHADVTLFENNTFSQSGLSINGVTYPAAGSTIIGNDDLTTATTFVLTHAKPDSADNDDLKITYKINGTCKRVESATDLAICEKHYLHDTIEDKVTDHDNSKDYVLPSYADTSKTIDVTIDGARKIKGASQHWTLTGSTVQFTGSTTLFTGQLVVLKFYVDISGSGHPTLLTKLDEVRGKVREMFGCIGEECNLTPVTNDSGQIVDYNPVYPSKEDPPPSVVIVPLNAKTVPLKYFDTNGKFEAEPDLTSVAQEGTVFEYTSNNLARPNNVSSYIGFNEIYGTIDLSDPNSPKPAKEVKIIKGKTYDIFVDKGIFSSCRYCGTDYNSSLARIFPETLLNYGGGYLPDPSQTNPRTTITHRRDDLLFGRACFLPATMIPWTHIKAGSSDPTDQRQNRMAAQHFLFSNGYQKDWFGFDYGSVIGSFDGIIWFSIGSSRQIKAKSNRLYLAVNSYFGDLTSGESDYAVTVSQVTTSIPDSGSTILHDRDTTGAQCQSYHKCDVDRDCITQLGWDYVCQSVTGIKSNYPLFDENGNEIPDTEQSYTIASIIGGTGSDSKRCIYRGKGAPCVSTLSALPANTFNGSDAIKSLGCAPNFYCASISSTGIFNDRIARFGRSVAYQNASSDVTESTLDTYGLGARSIGRAYSYNGDEDVPALAFTNLDAHDVDGICLPGKNLAATTIEELSGSSTISGDKYANIGNTEDSLISNSASYLSACPVLDNLGNYFHLDSSNLTTSTTDADYLDLVQTQNLPSNALSLFENSDHTGNSSIIMDYDSEQVTTAAFQSNSCLRAPGAACFSDLDCGSNDIARSFLSGLDPEDTSLPLNKYEISFWQSEMICSQDKTPDDEDYSLTNNRCCRDMGKDFKIGTDDGSSVFTADLAPGIGIALNDPTRYSLNAIIEEGKSLIEPSDNACAGTCADISPSPNDYQNQFTKIRDIGNKMCCSGHWVRNFNKTENGGGHEWSPAKMQNGWKKEAFSCMNWIPDANASNYTSALSGTVTLVDGTPNVVGVSTNFDGEIIPGEKLLIGGIFYEVDSITDDTNLTLTADPEVDLAGATAFNADVPLDCSSQDSIYDPGCNAKYTPESAANKLFDWLGSFEVLGIPQVIIKSGNGDEFPELKCSVNYKGTASGKNSLNGIIANTDFDTSNTSEYENGAERYFKANDEANFSSDMKQVFSEDTFSCCIPTNQKLKTGQTKEQCCTGFVNEQTQMCALPDFSDVTTYLNAYVSSAGKNLDSSLFNPNTGHVTSPEAVETIACSLKLCASNKLIRGISYGSYKVPGKVDIDEKIKKFIDSNDNSIHSKVYIDLFDNGVRWNTHVYCLPQDPPSDLPTDLKIYNCP